MNCYSFSQRKYKKTAAKTIKIKMSTTSQKIIAKIRFCRGYGDSVQQMKRTLTLSKNVIAFNSYRSHCSLLGPYWKLTMPHWIMGYDASDLKQTSRNFCLWINHLNWKQYHNFGYTSSNKQMIAGKSLHWFRECQISIVSKNISLSSTQVVEHYTRQNLFRKLVSHTATLFLIQTNNWYTYEISYPCQSSLKFLAIYARVLDRTSKKSK